MGCRRLCSSSSSRTELRVRRRHAADWCSCVNAETPSCVAGEPATVETAVQTPEPVDAATAEPASVDAALGAPEPAAVDAAVGASEPAAVETAVQTAEPAAEPVAIPVVLLEARLVREHVVGLGG